VVVQVRDNGVGIPAAMLPRIFDLFTQVDRGGDRSQGGLGIGLSLVRRLVEMHGGRVVARSGGAGAGSEFSVSLPLARDAAGVRPPRHPIAGRDGAGGDGAGERRCLRILVVDDNRDGADSMAMMLRARGDEVLTAYDGVEALQVADRFRPDVVLLDLGLPVLDGIQACRRLRARPGGDAMLIVAQTGWGQAEDRRRTREAGFDRHIVKPGDPDELLGLLDALRRGGVQALRAAAGG
jgi:CheY-like chemotaxis protein